MFGIPSEEWGEAVHAAVVVAPGASISADVVIAHARAHLASYKIPRSVSFHAELPKTGSGKLLKRDLPRPVLGRPNVHDRLSWEAIGRPPRSAGQPPVRPTTQPLTPTPTIHISETVKPS